MRSDFYFRLNSGEVFNLKSLRESPENIASFCQNFANDYKVKIDKKLIEFYKTLPWPGNYRQLKGHLQRKTVTTNSSVLSFDYSDERLIEQSSALEEIFNETITLKEAKIAYAKKIYYRSQENIAVAAKRLNISPKSLRGMVAS